ncbi:MAG: ATP-dependent DNA helicase RecG [Rickettsiales bacterium]|nr:ATP-dependent DNA helicase RecG [Rickettsiales bacterium]
MRPERLNFLFRGVADLVGVGKEKSKAYGRLLLRKNRATEDEEARVVDLLFHGPEKIVQRKIVTDVREIGESDVIVAKLDVVAHNPPRKSRQPFTITCYLGNNFVSVVFYRYFENYINSKFKIGSAVFVSGKVEFYNSQIQIVHPDYVCAAVDQIPLLEPVYPLTAGLTNRELGKNIQTILCGIPDLPEWLEEATLKSNGWCSWRDSLLNLHGPKTPFDPRNCKYIKRLAFDELLAQQLALSLVVTRTMKKSAKVPLASSEKKLRNRLLGEILPFRLTGDQASALEEIEADTFSDKCMMRLLQGDVGSGKTIVATLAMLNYVENHGQCVLMVPTTLLAIQHFANIGDICQKLSLEAELLTSSTRSSARKNILSRLKNGEIDILVGTHALIEENIEFKNLSFVVIDEQHRFGVKQRLRLMGKSKNIDILTMTATPIPRTLALALYSGMDLSVIAAKPVERKKVTTALVSMDKYDELISRMRERIEKNEKIYWICSLVEESENSYLSDVKNKYREFCDIFGKANVAFIHGKMPEKEKDSLLGDFCGRAGGMVLVSTTVIEVGIDARDATVIVIEHPERFGLSQLHQLRGRVGRGDKQSYCILLYDRDRCPESALVRLNIMRSTDDGFTLAEKDLKIRGLGEVIGNRQSGIHSYNFADLSRDFALLEQAIVSARAIVNGGNVGRYLDLLHIFGYANCLGDAMVLG